MTPEEEKDQKEWEEFLEACKEDGYDYLNDDDLNYELEDFTSDEEEPREDMTGQSKKGKKASPQASDDQGGRKDPEGSPVRGLVQKEPQVSGSRESQDTEMTDIPSESNPVIRQRGSPRQSGSQENTPRVEEPPPRDPNMQDTDLANRTSIQLAIAMQQAQAMPFIWDAAPEGAENLARRTAIIVGPTVAQFTTREEADTAREQNWRSRGLTPLGLTEEQLAEIRRLRTATIEFAALTRRNQNIPLGYNADDLLKLYIARSPSVLETDNLHLKLMAGEILTLKQKQQRRNETVQTLHFLLNEAHDRLELLEIR